MFGRKVIRVHVAGDHARLRFIQPRQIRYGPAKGRESFARFQVANVLADEDFFPDAQATLFFRWAPTAKMHGSDFLTVNRQRRIASRSAQHHLAAADHTRHRIIHVADDRSVMNEEIIGNCFQPLQRLTLIDADGFIAQIAAGGDDRESLALSSRDDATVSKVASPRDSGLAGATAGASSDLVRSARKQNDGCFRSQQQPLFQFRDVAILLNQIKRGIHQRKRFLLPALARSQASNRVARCERPRSAGTRRFL